jgi:hypothetical protein
VSGFNQVHGRLRAPVFLVLTCCVLTGVLVGCSGIDGTATAGLPSISEMQKEATQLVTMPKSADLTIVVNPSRLAEQRSFEHAIEIVDKTAAPNLAVVGIWEGYSTDDGPPFDRPWISTTSPSPGAPPELPKLAKCDSGTEFHRKKCLNAQSEKFAQALDALRTWRHNVDVQVVRWKHETAAQIKRVAAASRTEEAPENLWNLRDALLRSGQIFAAMPATHRCLVLLGGMAVKPPPSELALGNLAGVTMIASGWRGTGYVQTAWNDALAKVGTKVIFVPVSVTEITLLQNVTSCLVSGR